MDARVQRECSPESCPFISFIHDVVTLIRVPLPYLRLQEDELRQLVLNALA